MLTDIPTLFSITYVSHTLATFNIFRVLQARIACRAYYRYLKIWSGVLRMGGRDYFYVAYDGYQTTGLTVNICFSLLLWLLGRNFVA
jgi:hypothetical protein